MYHRVIFYLLYICTCVCKVIIYYLQCIDTINDILFFIVFYNVCINNNNMAQDTFTVYIYIYIYIYIYMYKYI